MRNNLDLTLEWNSLKALNNGADKKKIFILSSFTANPLEPYLGMDLYKNGINTSIKTGPYNQIISQCINSESDLYCYKPDYVVIWPRLEDIFGNIDFYESDSKLRYMQDIAMLAESVIKVAQSSKVIFMIPSLHEQRPLGVGDIQTQCGLIRISLESRLLLINKLSNKQNILMCDCEDILRRIGSDNAYNMTMYSLAKIPYTELYFDKIAQVISKVIQLNLDNKRKILVMDANILLCDGLKEFKDMEHINMKNLSFDDSYQRFQKYLKELSKWGTELMLCTASDEKDIKEILSREDVISDYDDFRYIETECTCIAEAISKVSNEYEIDQICFSILDTRDLKVRNMHMIHLQEEPSLWIEDVNSSNITSYLPALEECYYQEKEEENYNENMDLVSFLKDIKLEVNVKEIDILQKEKIEHITHSTKDFNFTGKQYSLDNLQECLDNQQYKVYGIHVSDRFGDYGIAGAIISKIQDKTAVIENLLLNCRILGKNVEYTVISQLVELFREDGCNEMVIQYNSNTRNQLAAQFISEICECDIKEIKTEEKIARDLSDVKRVAANALQDTCQVKKREKSCEIKNDGYKLFATLWNKKTSEQKKDILNNIDNLNSLEEILKDIRLINKRVRPDLSVQYIAPRTNTEEKVAELWKSILSVDRIGALDNFFAIGGKSLLAAQLIVKFQEVFGVKLPVRIFYDNSTVEQMAMFIDAMQNDNNREILDDIAINNFRYKTKEFLENEVWMDEDITTKGVKKEKSILQTNTVLLTGGTGFLGAFLLSELIVNTPFKIIVLVRAENEEAGFEKLKNNLITYELWKDDYKNRIGIVIGDLSKPMLGMKLMEFNSLARKIDMIYHNAAITNFMQPYKLIKDVNVQGTQEILRLACTYQVKPVHYISSHYVFSDIYHEDGYHVYEDKMPTSDEILVLGYIQTKWVSEQLVQIARDRGIPCSIYRSGRISGSSTTGACQTHDFMWTMIKSCVETGLLFKEAVNIEFVPVDYISKAIVHLSIQESSKNRNFHLVNPKACNLEDVARWMDEEGFKVKKYPYLEWKERILKKVAENPELETTRSILPFIPDDMKTWKKDLVYDTRNVEEGLKDIDVNCPKINEMIFKLYIRYFVKTGFFVKK